VKFLPHPAAGEGIADGCIYRGMERVLHDACADLERFWKFDLPARRLFGRSFPHAITFMEKTEPCRMVAGRKPSRRPCDVHGRLWLTES